MMQQAGDLAAFDTLARLGSNIEYIQQAFKTYIAGSPTSAAITWHMANQVENMSFDEVMDLEYIVAIHCSHNGEFAEGVRALLIDRDKNRSGNIRQIACLMVISKAILKLGNTICLRQPTFDGCDKIILSRQRQVCSHLTQL